MKKGIVILGLLIAIMSCSDIIEVVDISNETVKIIAPSNNVVIDTTAVTFTWETLKDTEQYHLQVATPTFEAATQIVVDTTLATTRFSKVLDTLPYEWRIKAENSAYQTAYTINGFLIKK